MVLGSGASHVIMMSGCPHMSPAQIHDSNLQRDLGRGHQTELSASVSGAWCEPSDFSPSSLAGKTSRITKGTSEC